VAGSTDSFKKESKGGENTERLLLKLEHDYGKEGVPEKGKEEVGNTPPPLDGEWLLRQGGGEQRRKVRRGKNQDAKFQTKELHTKQREGRNELQLILGTQKPVSS